jgi:hypothetical protein
MAAEAESEQGILAGSEQLAFTSSSLLVVSIRQASNVARRSQVQPLGNPRLTPDAD